MVTESEVLALRSRIAELEEKLEFLYRHLHLSYAPGGVVSDQRVIDILRTRNKIEAIKVYRELYNVGLAEAKNAVDALETQLGL